MTLKIEHMRHSLLTIILILLSNSIGLKAQNKQGDSIQKDRFIYVSDAGNFNKPPWQILEYDINGENPKVFISQDQGLDWPQDILFLEERNEVLISNLNSGVINRHKATTGELIDSFATGIAGPTRIKIGNDRLLYVLQWSGKGTVLRYDLDGIFKGEFTSVKVPQSIGMDWDKSGNLYISSFADANVRKFDSKGKDLGIFINSNLQGPTNIWFDDQGNLLVNDWKGGQITKFDAEGNFLSHVITGLKQSEGVDFLPNGDFLIGNGGTAEIKLYDKDCKFKKDLVQEGSGGLIRPNAVIIRSLK